MSLLPELFLQVLRIELAVLLIFFCPATVFKDPKILPRLQCSQRKVNRSKLRSYWFLASSSDNSTNTSSNLGCNSCVSDKWKKVSGRGYSIEAKVYHIIDASEIELTPAEITRKIHDDGSENWNPKMIRPGQYTTVRVVCARLLQKGLVIQPYPGAYCNKITYGVRFVPLAVHNVRLHSNLCQNVKHWEIDEVVGGVKISVVFWERTSKS